MKRYRLRPAKDEEIVLLIEWDRQVYPEGDVVEWKTVKSWFDKNNKIIQVLVDSSDQIVGYFTAIPLKKGAALKIISEKESEEEIRLSDITTFDSDEEFDIYIASIVIPYEQRSNATILALFREFSNYLARVSKLKVQNFYALAISNEGYKFLRSSGFTTYNPLKRDRIPMVLCATDIK